MRDTIKTDRIGNYIGDGTFHADYTTFEIDNVTVDVNLSETTESVYITYTNVLNGNTCRVRFSNHECNAVKFGNILDGNFCTLNDVMYHLGMIERVFVPETYLYISSITVGKKDLDKYEVSDLTIQEMYNMGEGADLTKHVGKLALNSNYLIQDNIVRKFNKTKRNVFGFDVQVGKFVYSNI